MASKAAGKAAGSVMNIATKQTVQSVGLWETIRRFFALDPNRSTGIPLNPYFRNPAPGSNDPLQFDDPVTLPAGDIAGNPYWVRDSRRSYPRLSTVKQSDLVPLLAVGSAAAPKVELIGETGEKALVEAKSQGKQEGLSAFVSKKGGIAAAKETLMPGGLPPLPSGSRLVEGKWDVHKYKLSDVSYPHVDKNPCRSFK